MNKVWFSLALLIGVIVGQLTTSYALNPETLRSEAFKLAGLAYRFGCADAGGKDCALKAFNYEGSLRHHMPIDPKDE